MGRHGVQRTNRSQADHPADPIGSRPKGTSPKGSRVRMVTSGVVGALALSLIPGAMITVSAAGAGTEMEAPADAASSWSRLGKPWGPRDRAPGHSNSDRAARATTPASPSTGAAGAPGASIPSTPSTPSATPSPAGTSGAGTTSPSAEGSGSTPASVAGTGSTAGTSAAAPPPAGSATTSPSAAAPVAVPSTAIGTNATATVSSAQALFSPSAFVPTGSVFTSNGERFTVQSPAKPWSLSNYPTAAYSRVELRAGDRWVNDLRYSDGRQRVKLRGQTRWPKGSDLWFAYSFRWSGQMPTAWANVTELHSDLESGETQGKPPPFSLGFSRGQFFLNTRSDARAATTSKVDPVVRYSMPVFPKDTWQNIVVRVKLDPFGNGRLTFWLNGAQKYDSGAIPIGYNDVQGPYFKYGLYRGASDVTTSAEFANVEIGTTSLLARVTAPKPLPR